MLSWPAARGDGTRTLGLQRERRSQGVGPIGQQHGFKEGHRMKGEVEKLQGTWNVVALEIDGAALADHAFRGSQILVKGHRFATVSMGATYKGKLKVDATKTPKALDLLFEEGPEKGNQS